ncbi:uncharacterized protein LOC121744051 [Salvia splendens]|uniref:uncharacterized protein LOC121744051 n=1 Tax=Salvia splendens TaxID=180675 RepID=UPI001C262EFA|nr:uncharacterized protein LOC121744051 [Salvia splendens]
MTNELTQTKVARRRKELSYFMLVLEEIITSHRLNMLVIWMLISIIISKKTKKTRRFWTNRFSLLERIPTNVHHINRLVGVTDRSCMDNLRMDRNTFGRLCRLLNDVSGLVDKKFVTVEEMVAMFLGILAHHNKTRVVGFHFLRSSQTVSRYLHVVLYGVLKLHEILLVKPEPVDENCTDARWKWFKGCLGALDGTYINVRVPTTDLPRYRNKK